MTVDDSPCITRMQASLAAHDEWLGGRHQHTVLAAVLAIPPRAAAGFERKAHQSCYAFTAEAVSKPTRAFLRKQNIEAEFYAKVGPPAEVIIKLVESKRFDMLMMARTASGRSATTC